MCCMKLANVVLASEQQRISYQLNICNLFMKVSHGYSVHYY
jgi:hypothetical protein